MNQIILRREQPDDRAKVGTFIHRLPLDKAWEVEVREYRRRRTDQQNRYLWGVCYETILKTGGETLAGWTKEDLHEHFLGEAFGNEWLKLGGKEYIRPRRRSSRLNKQEFSDLIAVIQREAAKLGIYIPDPEEHLAP